MMRMITHIKGKLKSKEAEDRILGLILCDGLHEGDPILSESRLGELFEVSRITVRQAIAELTAKNILYTVKGKGTFVTKTGARLAAEKGANASKTIALIFPSISDSYFSAIARGIEDKARERGADIMFWSTDGYKEREEEDIHIAMRRNVDGIILSPSESYPTIPYLKQVCLSHSKLVVINEAPFGCEVSSVSSDDCEGGYAATRMLLELGHRRIAHLRGPELVANAHARIEGYKKALAEYGGVRKAELIGGGRTYARDDGYATTLRLLNDLSPAMRPTAIFAASDMLAWGAIDAVREKGLRIPEDISIIGYGDLLESAKMGIQLSSVNQNPSEIGRTACELLFESGGGARTPRKVLLPPRLVPRASCGPLDASTQQCKVRRHLG